jgi:hypothetical protein
LQALAVVAICALVGLSGSRISGGDAANGWFLAGAGGIIGLVAIVIVAAMARSTTLTGEAAMQAPPGAKLGMSGLAVGVIGFIVCALLSSGLGYVLLVSGLAMAAVGLFTWRLHEYRGGKK